MTSVPLSRSTPPPDRSGLISQDITPVFALKELVARLHREHHNVQDMLSSLGFALRSFNNLNQFLELISLVATRLTDTDGGALVLFKPNGQIRFHQLHCQEGRQCQDVRWALENATREITGNGLQALAEAEVPLSSIASLDFKVSRYLGPDVQLFGTPILVKNIERGRLYVFSHDPQYTWTPSRQKLIRLVADQTAVAIATDELSLKLKEKERLDKELEIGAEIQLRLLPRNCPKIPGVNIGTMSNRGSSRGRLL